MPSRFSRIRVHQRLKSARDGDIPVQRPFSRSRDPGRARKPPASAAWRYGRAKREAAGMSAPLLQPGHKPADWKCLLSGKTDISGFQGHVLNVLSLDI